MLRIASDWHILYVMIFTDWCTKQPASRAGAFSRFANIEVQWGRHVALACQANQVGNGLLDKMPIMRVTGRFKESCISGAA